MAQENQIIIIDNQKYKQRMEFYDNCKVTINVPVYTKEEKEEKEEKEKEILLQIYNHFINKNM